MRVRYTDQDCDEEYEVCWRCPLNNEEHSELFDTLEATKDLRLQLELHAIDVSIYLLSTHYDGLGDETGKTSELVYRTGEENND